MSRPRRHHYLPVFYLKRWADPSGRIVEFSRPYGNVVKPRRVFPAGTGFVEHLYSHADENDGRKPLLEEQLFKPVDSQAADALTLLEQRAPRHAWTSELRQAWCRFLNSLLFRMPADIDALRASYTDDWGLVTQEEQEQYKTTRQPDDPGTLEEYLATLDATSIHNLALELLPGLVEMEEPTRFIMNMHWFTMDAPTNGPALITSDRPLVQAPLGGDDPFVYMPIGPYRMFWAVREPQAERRFRRNLPNDWVRTANQDVLRRSTRFAYCNTDAPLAFAQKHLATDPLPSMFKDMM